MTPNGEVGRTTEAPASSGSLGAPQFLQDSTPPDIAMVPCTPLDWTQGNLFAGLRCFHSGAFFEAHEHWESVWLAAQEPEKTFLQGLIQIAAAFYHL